MYVETPSVDGRNPVQNPMEVTSEMTAFAGGYFLFLFAASIRRHEASRFASLFQAPYNSRFEVSTCFEAGYCHCALALGYQDCVGAFAIFRR